MNPETDLKALERKAYLSYHNDGLLDIGLGLLILSVGIGWLCGMPWLAGILFAVGISSYAGAKKAITIPRLGLVRFGPARRKRQKRETSFFMMYFTLTALLGVVMFLVVININRSPGGFGRILEKFIMAPYSILVAIAFACLAYWKQIPRYYIYAIMLLIAVIAGPLLGIYHGIYFSTPGVVITMVGLYLLIRFLKTYPLVEKEYPDYA